MHENATHPPLFPLDPAGEVCIVANLAVPRPRSRPTKRRAAMQVCVLGSGSGGNSTALRLDAATGCDRPPVLLVDAGLGPRVTIARLAEAGVEPGQLRGILLTHLDRDHFQPRWVSTLIKLGVMLLCHRWHLPDLLRLRGASALQEAGLIRGFEDEPFRPLDDLPLVADPIRLQHDRQGTIGYRLSILGEGDAGAVASVGYATDLGHAPSALVTHLAGVEVLCLESNYDVGMTIHSTRPSFVNRRNLSDSGHLSNEQAFEAVCRISDASPHGGPRSVVLLHRSSQCNHPMKVRRVFERDPALARRIVLSEQRRRTRWVPVVPRRAVQRRQLVLGW